MSRCDDPSAGIPAAPLMTIEIADPACGLEGYVCIHSLGSEGASGGMRCVPDVTKSEVQILARAMTYKYSFFGIPQGGAKAGLRVRDDAPPEERRELIRAAACHLEPIIKRSNIWSVWTDMNFYQADLSEFYSAINIPWSLSGSGGSSLRTAVTALWSIQACIDYFELPAPRIAIEGYGSVAKYLAKYLVELGCRIVAVSNRAGTAHNPSGLDVELIETATTKHGVDWVTREGQWERLTREELFQLESDILIPGARVHSIDATIAAACQTRLVVPVANVPCTGEALSELDRRGIPYLPDYVVNSGGVCGWIQSRDDEYGVAFREVIGRLLTRAEERRVPVRSLADDAAHANYSVLARQAYPMRSRREAITRVLRRLGVPLLRPEDARDPGAVASQRLRRI